MLSLHGDPEVAIGLYIGCGQKAPEEEEHNKQFNCTIYTAWGNPAEVDDVVDVGFGLAGLGNVFENVLAHLELAQTGSLEQKKRKEEELKV